MQSQKSNTADAVSNLLEELFKLIGIEVGVEISEEKDPSADAQDATFYKVALEPGESAGLLIGARGMTLASLQSFVTIALKQQTGDWVKITMDVAGWNEKQNDRLNDMARQTAERARETGEAQMLYNLNGQQRRIVHMALKEESDIETFSEGEGSDRYLVIKVKK